MWKFHHLGDLYSINYAQDINAHTHASIIEDGNVFFGIINSNSRIYSRKLLLITHMFRKSLKYPDGDEDVVFEEDEEEEEGYLFAEQGIGPRYLIRLMRNFDHLIIYI
jgi:hypothetical protein